MADQIQTSKRGRGRPKKTAEDSASQPKRGRGRPKKTVDDSAHSQPKKARGRPKKTVENQPSSLKPRGGEGEVPPPPAGLMRRAPFQLVESQKWM